MNNKGLKAKILGPIVFAILVMVVTSVISIVTMNKTRSQIAKVRDQHVKEMETIQEIRYTVLHTAEILTDVSATHDDGGFAEAAEFRDEVYALTEQIKKLDSARTKMWDDILSKYENYYNLCVEMAHAYIEQGVDAGNEIMEVVDGVTDELSEVVDGTTADVEKALEDEVKKISSGATRVSGILIASVVIYIVLMLYIAFTVIRQMLIPIAQVNVAIQELAARNLTGDELYTTQRDEIGGLIRAYNELRASLRDIMENMDTSAGQLEEMSATMAQNSDVIMNNISEITTAVNNVSELATNQAYDIEHSLSELDQLHSIAEQNEKTSRNLSEASDRISEASREGNRVLDELYDVSKQSEEAFSDIFDSIELIKDSTAKISEASNMIDSIAKQTNLLSLNASIEAARAGEAGMGFAVVADEIRSLSDESARSVSEINQMIKTLQDNVGHADKQSHVLRNAVEKQMTGVEDTKNSYKDISENLEVINEEIVRLGEVSQIMTESCNTVGEAMRNISQAAEENAANTEETTASIEEVLSLTEQIANGSGQIKEGTDVLSEVVKTYQI